MQTITIPKKEYQKLVSKAKALEKLAVHIFEKVIKDPVKDVVEDFRRTNLYTGEFITDLEEGLKKSSYSKTHR